MTRLCSAAGALVPLPCGKVVIVETPDWRTVLAKHQGSEMRKPAPPGRIERVETALKAVLPADLRALYLLSDGLFDTVGQWFVIWPLGQLLDRNRWAWAHEASVRRQLVGFGDDGTGAAFCVPRDGSVGVFVWNSIDNQAHRLADTVEEFWTAWATGKITT